MRSNIDPPHMKCWQHDERTRARVLIAFLAYMLVCVQVCHIFLSVQCILLYNCAMRCCRELLVVGGGVIIIAHNYSCYSENGHAHAFAHAAFFYLVSFYMGINSPSQPASQSVIHAALDDSNRDREKKERLYDDYTFLGRTRAAQTTQRCCNRNHLTHATTPSP